MSQHAYFLLLMIPAYCPCSCKSIEAFILEIGLVVEELRLSFCLFPEFPICSYFAHTEFWARLWIHGWLVLGHVLHAMWLVSQLESICAQNGRHTKMCHPHRIGYNLWSTGLFSLLKAWLRSPSHGLGICEVKCEKMRHMCMSHFSPFWHLTWWACSACPLDHSDVFKVWFGPLNVKLWSI